MWFSPVDRGRVGYAFAELLVALGIFSIGMLGIASLIGAGAKIGSVALGQTYAVQMAQQRMSEIRLDGRDRWIARLNQMSDPYEEIDQAWGVQRKAVVSLQPQPIGPPAVRVDIDCTWTDTSSQQPFVYSLSALLATPPPR